MRRSDFKTHTAYPPSDRPILVWDGECGFCRKSVERIRFLISDRVDYAAYQDLGDRFPDIPRALFARSVHLIEPDGRVTTGAEAIFTLLGFSPAGSAWMACYRHLPGFAAISERVYEWVANRRRFVSTISRWLVGPDFLPRRHRLTRWLLLRLLGLVALMAFASMAVQVDGLIGSRGILPASGYMDHLDSVASRLEAVFEVGDPRGWASGERYLRVPTLGWLDTSDPFLSGMTWAGIALSVLLVFDVAPAFVLMALWLIYLSLSLLGNVFFSYQWDTLLVEALFSAVFVAPWRLRPRLQGDPEPGRLGLVVMRLLVFKLMWLSGMVKLLSHDPTWRDGTALDYHFFTQPLPTWTAYYAHHLPHWIHEGSVWIVLAIELVLPFFIFGPRRMRAVAFVGTVFLMAMIGLTGNFGFFNLLAVALAISILDDSLLVRWVPMRWRSLASPSGHAASPVARSRRLVIGLLATIVVGLSILKTIERVAPVRLPDFAHRLLERTDPFRTINGYGLFASMTTSRPEIIIEGRRNGDDWRPYVFRWKIGELDRPMSFTGPHMPRLDWQMWFAALRGCERAPWFHSFLLRLLEADPVVLDLMAGDPFAGERPLEIRTTVYDYRFTTLREKARSGRLWRRSDPRPYCPSIALLDVDEARIDAGADEDPSRWPDGDGSERPRKRE